MDREYDGKRDLGQLTLEVRASVIAPDVYRAAVKEYMYCGLKFVEADIPDDQVEVHHKDGRIERYKLINGEAVKMGQFRLVLKNSR